MGTVIIHEWMDVKRDRRGEDSGVLFGVLATDHEGVAIKSETTSGTALSCDPLTSKTEFVTIWASSGSCHYAVKPKGGSVVTATTSHPKIASGATATIGVYPGATISLLEGS